ncbi:ATP-dependent zinc metalloprotease FtsH [Planctomyces sp. SH-PL62]|uniref:ATP-dependent zinc metalloprotease FtsH n=1 Tax=Planctomyces sp. SH-PL62 TaxID=1636152 RepID=UPI00078CEAC8|nr:ATP-dependent zinc metalloprotease FtsH [Planctomyces sp. SH-PL62]AMV38210.1 ATP-dependent zinc metalloprotease FtsH [Planctomyces sp. SH-PL62]
MNRFPLSHHTRRGRRNLTLLATVVALGLAATFGLLVYLDDPVQDLSYGQFRRKLAEGGVSSARVGPAAIQGLLAPASPEAAAVSYRVSRLGMEHDEDLIRLLEAHVPNGDYDAEPAPSPVWTMAVPTVMFLMMVAVLALVVARSGGMGSALAFSKSRPRVYGADEPRVTFESVAGHDEVVAELREVVDFLRTPGKFQSLGGRIPKGVLLVGAPGTGKTLLARAVAGEAGVPFFSLSGSDFVELFVGVGAARVRSLFARAQAKAPSLIFIDELDAIGKARGAGGSGGHDERDQTLNQLLVEMDGFDADRGVILLAATNRPETLDPALVRPGRFDRQVVVDRPDLVGREQILKVHSRVVPLADDLSLRQIAAMTPGFVGADLANLVNEAALLAARRGKDHVGQPEFEDGIERLIAGPEKRQRLLRPDEKQRIAYHEAGHALVARSLPQTDPVHKVSIVGRGAAALGYTLYRPEDDRFLHTRTALEHAVCCLLGGTLAEEIALGEASDGCTSDLSRATEIASRMVLDFGMSPVLGRLRYSGDGDAARGYSERTAREIDLEVRRIVGEAMTKARAILEDRREALDRLADRLIERETLNAADLDELLGR